MTTGTSEVVGLAASFNMVSFVYFRRGDLGDWGNSRKAAESIDAGFAATSRWLVRYEPDVVIFPTYGEGSRKGRFTKALIEAAAAAAAQRGIPCERIERPRTFRSKQKEAEALARVFPQIAPLLPRPRRPWEVEPRNMLIFEALAITHSWLRSQRSPRL
jgi:hypothetical protein